MSRAKRDLPDFERPPVVEVLASVQFEQLALTTAVVGDWWQQIKSRFPHVEDKAPIETGLEEFGEPQPPRMQLQVLSGPPRTRTWFMNEPNGIELLQLQNDRLIFNWRGHDTDRPYPRYEFVRERFSKLYSEFEKFVISRKLGSKLNPIQCELTYVNHIMKGRGWEEPSDWDSVLKFLNNINPGNDEQELENIVSRLVFRIKNAENKPFARLYVVAEKRFVAKTMEPLLYLEYNMKGMPQSDEKEGVISFLNAAHKIIVTNFGDMTDKKMHKLWRRRNA